MFHFNYDFVIRLFLCEKTFSALAVKNIEVNFIFIARLLLSLDKIFCTRCEKY